MLVGKIPHELTVFNFKVQVTSSWWRHRNRTHSRYSGIYFPQNVYLRFFTLWKL